jgi:phosphoglucosamine mutase
MSNIGLYQALDAEGIKYEKTAVGDKYVCENMMTNGHCLGGEQSGHIIFSKHATTGDGILTSLKVMEAILENKSTLGILRRKLKIFPQILVNIRVDDKDRIMNNEEVKNIEKKVSDELGTNGRLLLRPSGTEPLIRVMVEAETDELCKKYADMVTEVINKL